MPIVPSCRHSRIDQMLGGNSVQSTAADALEAAGDKESAADIGALDRAAAAAERKVVSTRRGRGPWSDRATRPGRTRQTYLELAQLEESLCASGLGPWAAQYVPADGVRRHADRLCPDRSRNRRQRQENPSLRREDRQGGRPARNAAIVASSMPACRDRNVCPIVQ